MKGVLSYEKWEESERRPRRTRGVAALGVERQHFDGLVVGAGRQQPAAAAPGRAVDGALVVLVPPEEDRRLLDATATAGRTLRVLELEPTAYSAPEGWKATARTACVSSSWLSFTNRALAPPPWTRELRSQTQFLSVSGGQARGAEDRGLPALGGGVLTPGGGVLTPSGGLLTPPPGAALGGPGSGVVPVLVVHGVGSSSPLGSMPTFISSSFWMDLDRQRCVWPQ
ncbi:hypothetical protein EYF80_053202 [Liparis tanakae]|uniref:Uncharacterized protein n=1 Tax=Liparis tanakae TaxID=230148 RepID=A0A4Z2F759_9TELE|nr:hypothetical protein EYF80_053202 [Liparis tanakae]